MVKETSITDSYGVIPSSWLEDKTLSNVELRLLVVLCCADQPNGDGIRSGVVSLTRDQLSVKMGGVSKIYISKLVSKLETKKYIRRETSLGRRNKLIITGPGYVESKSIIHTDHRLTLSESPCPALHNSRSIIHTDHPYTLRPVVPVYNTFRKSQSHKGNYKEGEKARKTLKNDILAKHQTLILSGHGYAYPPMLELPIDDLPNRLTPPHPLRVSKVLKKEKKEKKKNKSTKKTRQKKQPIYDPEIIKKELAKIDLNKFKLKYEPQGLFIDILFDNFYAKISSQNNPNPYNYVCFDSAFRTWCNRELKTILENKKAIIDSSPPIVNHAAEQDKEILDEIKRTEQLLEKIKKLPPNELTSIKNQAKLMLDNKTPNWRKIGGQKLSLDFAMIEIYQEIIGSDR
jgi:DNA-binding MarR family transcriptional regulator